MNSKQIFYLRNMIRKNIDEKTSSVKCIVGPILSNYNSKPGYFNVRTFTQKGWKTSQQR